MKGWLGDIYKKEKMKTSQTSILNISLNIYNKHNRMYYERDPRFLHVDLSNKDRIIGYIVEGI